MRQPRQPRADARRPGAPWRHREMMLIWPSRSRIAYLVWSSRFEALGRTRLLEEVIFVHVEGPGALLEHAPVLDHKRGGVVEQRVQALRTKATVSRNQLITRSVISERPAAVTDCSPRRTSPITSAMMSRMTRGRSPLRTATVCRRERTAGARRGRSRLCGGSVHRGLRVDELPVKAGSFRGVSEKVTTLGARPSNLNTTRPSRAVWLSGSGSTPPNSNPSRKLRSSETSVVPCPPRNRTSTSVTRKRFAGCRRAPAVPQRSSRQRVEPG